MLAHARSEARLRYAAATAEMLPFRSETFNLVTAGLAFHWFDRPVFLAEAHRVLTAEGWLVIYNNWFKGPSHQNPAFDRWWSERYLPRYPTPARSSTRLAEAEARIAGFIVHSDSAFDIAVRMSRAELVAYLTTQTNVIAAVQSGAESGRSITDWLTESVSAVIGSEGESFLFGHSLSVFRRSSR
jgi:SAM-dependent methyltransferase